VSTPKRFTSVIMSTPLSDSTSIWALIGTPFFTSVATTDQSTFSSASSRWCRHRM